MLNEITVVPIGRVSSPNRETVDDVWGNVRAEISLDSARFTSESLLGLDQFSHVEIVFVFHMVKDNDVNPGARHPRGRRDWPRVGIFAQRAKNRPNRVGVSVCRLLSVTELSIIVEGLDAVEGTPVLDIKPY